MMEGVMTGATRAQSYGATDAVREKEVDSQLRQLFESIERAHVAGVELGNSLALVSRSQLNDNKPVPEPVLCPLADQLRKARMAIESLSYLLNDARQRLEI